MDEASGAGAGTGAGFAREAGFFSAAASFPGSGRDIASLGCVRFVAFWFFFAELSVLGAGLFVRRCVLVFFPWYLGAVDCLGVETPLSPDVADGAPACVRVVGTAFSLAGSGAVTAALNDVCDAVQAKKTAQSMTQRQKKKPCALLEEWRRDALQNGILEFVFSFISHDSSGPSAYPSRRAL